MKIHTRSLIFVLSLSVISTLSAHASTVKAPLGVRPCCAFGKDLKAKVGAVPVPFLSLNNVLGINDIGSHRYNDGSSSVAVNLLGLSKEKNGLLFSTQGGFIDTAHVRDTADYTYYLFQNMQGSLGTSHALNLPAELKVRRIQWVDNKTPLSAAEKNQLSADAAALLAFRLAQWHEIAQWFGMVSVRGFKEYASAFSAEDLYSNMLGANLAKTILLAHPDIQISDFNREMDVIFAKQMKALGVQPVAITNEKMEQLDGVWWDSSQRLPDKWVVIFRDYRFGLQLSPNYPGADHPLSLSERSVNDQPIAQWVQLELHSAGKDNAFDQLPNGIKTQKIWTVEYFQLLANFAKQQDTRELEERRYSQTQPLP
ncbi:DUF4056 domain-containing protein [Photobacterium nomapromontoriensis]|uniref:DUF4056 domain-containing protein n=1 Tax=Photobacterium nomapromontoriensis TaxID=2910237 RepID=UPI003D14CB7A